MRMEHRRTRETFFSVMAIQTLLWILGRRSKPGMRNDLTMPSIRKNADVDVPMEEFKSSVD